MQLTKNELQIMQVLWREGKPLLRSEILAACVDRTWKDGSIHILLNSLIAQGAIKEAGYGRSGKSIGRMYAARISAAEYFIETDIAPLGVAYIPALVKAMIDQKGITKEILEQTKEIVTERSRDFESEVPGG